MARILGLDLGGYSVKAVVHDASLRGSQVKAYAEIVRSEGDRQESLRLALRQLFANPALQADQVVVAVPGPGVTTHQLQLPFIDPKRLDATVGFEVEAQLPFELSEAVYDYVVASQHDKKSDLLVGVVKKDELEKLLALLKESGVDPRVVTHPAVAYHGLFLQGPVGAEAVGEDEAVAVVDLGHERTTLAIGRPGSGIELGRIFPGGGHDLTRAVATDLELPYAEANAWKEKNGAVGDAVPIDAERGSAAIIRALAPIVRELRSTMKAYAARTKRRVAHVYLCGGTAKLDGLADRWSAELGIPTQLLAMPMDAAAAIPEDVRPALCQAYALASRSPTATTRAARFNLRRGALAFQGHYGYVRERVGLLASYGATILVLAIAAGVVRGSVLARRERQVGNALCDITERVLHHCEKDFDRALNMLKGQESASAALPKQSAVDLLAELVARIPKEDEAKKPFPVTFDQMLVDLERISLRGQTESTKDVDRLTNALKGYRCFQEIKQGRLEKTKDGSKVLFRLDIRVECPTEQGQG
jgi:general secretion pathway protein L